MLVQAQSYPSHSQCVLKHMSATVQKEVASDGSKKVQSIQKCLSVGDMSMLVYKRHMGTPKHARKQVTNHKVVVSLFPHCCSLKTHQPLIFQHNQSSLPSSEFWKSVTLRVSVITYKPIWESSEKQPSGLVTLQGDKTKIMSLVKPKVLFIHKKYNEI